MPKCVTFKRVPVDARVVLDELLKDETAREGATAVQYIAGLAKAVCKELPQKHDPVGVQRVLGCYGSHIKFPLPGATGRQPQKIDYHLSHKTLIVWHPGVVNNVDICCPKCNKPTFVEGDGFAKAPRQVHGLDGEEWYVFAHKSRCKNPEHGGDVCFMDSDADVVAKMPLYALLPVYLTHKSGLDKRILDNAYAHAVEGSEAFNAFVTIHNQRAHQWFYEAENHYLSQGTSRDTRDVRVLLGAAVNLPDFGGFADEDGWNGLSLNSQYLTDVLLEYIQPRLQYQQECQKSITGKVISIDATYANAAKVKVAHADAYKGSIFVLNEYSEVMASYHGDGELGTAEDNLWLLDRRHTLRGVPNPILAFTDARERDGPVLKRAFSSLGKGVQGIPEGTKKGVLEDVWHFMGRFTDSFSKDGHCKAEEHQKALSKAVFLEVAEDRVAYLQRTANKPREPRPTEIRNYIPQPEELYTRLEAVKDRFWDMADDLGVRLYTEDTEALWDRALAAVKDGAYSDPTNLEIAINRETDPSKPPDWTKPRGTNKCELFNLHHQQRLSGGNNSPALAELIFVGHVHGWNIRAGIRNRGQQDYGVTDLRVLLDIEKIRGRLHLGPKYKVAHEYIETDEVLHFGWEKAKALVPALKEKDAADQLRRLQAAHAASAQLTAPPAQPLAVEQLTAQMLTALQHIAAQQQPTEPVGGRQLADVHTWALQLATQFVQQLAAQGPAQQCAGQGQAGLQLARQQAVQSSAQLQHAGQLSAQSSAQQQAGQLSAQSSAQQRPEHPQARQPSAQQQAGQLSAQSSAQQRPEHPQARQPSAKQQAGQLSAQSSAQQRPGHQQAGQSSGQPSARQQAEHQQVGQPSAQSSAQQQPGLHAAGQLSAGQWSSSTAEGVTAPDSTWPLNVRLTNTHVHSPGPSTSGGKKRKAAALAAGMLGTEPTQHAGQQAAISARSGKENSFPPSRSPSCPPPLAPFLPSPIPPSTAPSSPPLAAVLHGVPVQAAGAAGQPVPAPRSWWKNNQRDTVAVGRVLPAKQLQPSGMATGAVIALPPNKKLRGEGGHSGKGGAGISKTCVACRDHGIIRGRHTRKEPCPYNKTEESDL